MQKRFRILIGIAVVLVLAVGVYYLPPVHSRLAWRIDDLRAKVRYALNPPEKVEFDPGVSSTPVAIRTPPTQRPTLIRRDVPPERLYTPTPTLTPTPLPPAVNLKSDTFRYYDQHGLYNYCAPSTLAMAVSFWGWKGERTDVGDVVKPYRKDLNVMPYEMADFAEEHAGLGAIVRVGGDVDLVKRFIVAGFPVLVEKGVHFRDLAGEVTWMGHYAFITGYDDAQGAFVTQDSYVTPGTDYPVSYADLTIQWRSFNYTYIILYPKDRESEVLAALGPQADETYNYQYAAQVASAEIYSDLPDVERFFAW
ncbi:MAG: C39 family peptidase, partial [Anaerolineales bacterium]|nr:C39 family peptidase [Anaerolineales bacterium]